jgi:RP/EB family microtubule-associated protein
MKYEFRLRKIEILCQDHEGETHLEIQKLFDVLYETEEGFAAPEDGDENAE